MRYPLNESDICAGRRTRINPVVRTTATTPMRTRARELTAPRGAALTQATTAHVVTVPCDSPFLPLDLVARLATGMAHASAQIAVAKTFTQPHPVFALVSRAVLAHLTDYLGAGGRKIDAWYATLAVVEVAFDDEADAFRNINTAEELAAATPTRA